MARFVQYVDSIKLKDIQKKVNERIDDLKFTYNIWLEISKILKEWDGKKITKRTIDNLIENTKHKYIITLDNNISNLYYLKISDKQTGSECRTFLGYSNVLDYNKYMNEYSISEQNCKPSYEKLEKSYDKIPAFVKEYNEILIKAKALVKKATTANLEYDFDIVANAR